MINQTQRRRGIFLPVVAVMMLLVMMSVLMVSRYGSDTRYLLRRAEAAELCREAALSAATEVRNAIASELNLPPEDWPQWIKDLLPPFSDEVTPVDGLSAIITSDSFKSKDVVISGITLRCIDRRTGHRVKAQGLLEIKVRAECKLATMAPVSMLRTECIRYYVQYETVSFTVDPNNAAISFPVVKPKISLFPLCSSEVGGATL